nr:zinc ribbon domain-containing protein [Desulforamulus aeronauticus]
MRVIAHGSSQECSQCGAIVKKDLAERIHRCRHCGLVLDRDHNAAKVLEKRAS